jgi:integrase
VRVEANIYSRTDSRGRKVLEIGYRDSAGKQRWQRVDGGIIAARTIRNDLLGRRGKGERVEPSPRLRFDEAATAWREGQVADLRPATQAAYGSALRNHLYPRGGSRRLDTISVEDVAAMIRDLRANGLSEWTIHSILTAANRTFKFAKRRMGWHGENPVAELEKGERPSVTAAARRPIFTPEQLAATLAAAREPYKTLFAVGSVTGARLSECLGLVWEDVGLSDLDAAEIRFEHQVDRLGRLQPLKTAESRRAVEIPRSLAVMLATHKLRSSDTRPAAFVFVTRTGRPINQREVGLALRRAQARARSPSGYSVFPILHERDQKGRPRPVARGLLPSFHSLRHSAASEAIAAGDSAEEVSWQLGHKNSLITRAIYVREIKSVERTARRRARMEERYGRMLAFSRSPVDPSDPDVDAVRLSEPEDAQPER